MPRFVDRQTARFVDLGPCECPGTPHDNDWMKVRSKLTYGEFLELGDRAAQGSLAAQAYLLTTKIIEWSWTDEDGKSVPIETSTIANLDPMTAARLARLLDEPREKKAPDPKPSGARSRKR